MSKTQNELEKAGGQKWTHSLIVSLIDPDHTKCKYELRAYSSGLFNGVFIGMVLGAALVTLLNIICYRQF